MNVGNLAKEAIEEAAAEDAKMSLERHDQIYHHGHYTPNQKCEVREMMALGDDSDATVGVATRAEGSRKMARDFERDMIARAFAAEIPIVRSEAAKRKYGADVAVGEQDENGDVTVKITAFPVVPDDAVTKDVVKKIVEGKGGQGSDRAMYQYAGTGDRERELAIRRVNGIGYKLKDFQVKTLRGNNVKNGGKKMFVVRMHKDAMVGELATDVKMRLEALKEAARKRSAEKPMTEAEKSLALKRYGLKIEDGKVKPRAGREDETPTERYLRMVGIGETIPKTNAEIKRQKELEDALRKEERKNFLDELGLMDDDFFRKLG